MNSDRSIEATGEDVEEAIANGLSVLGVGPGDVIVEVLEEPSRGMFGLGSRPARVRLQLLIVPAPSSEQADTVEPARVEKQAEPQPEDDLDDVEDDYDDSDEDDDFIPRAEVYDGPIGEDAEVGKVVLTELLEHMNIRAEVVVRRSANEDDEENAPWLLDVTGQGDLTVLIGRRGETLASLQYITRLITSRELQRRANIIVDVDGYKFRRTSKLHDLARRMAEQAIGEQRTITLEPMPPYERRIVHLALRGRDDVYTESVGEGSARKVTIIPKS